MHGELGRLRSAISFRGLGKREGSGRLRSGSFGFHDRWLVCCFRGAGDWSGGTGPRALAAWVCGILRLAGRFGFSGGFDVLLFQGAGSLRRMYRERCTSRAEHCSLAGFYYRGFNCGVELCGDEFRNDGDSDYDARDMRLQLGRYQACHPGPHCRYVFAERFFRLVDEALGSRQVDALWYDRLRFRSCSRFPRTKADSLLGGFDSFGGRVEFSFRQRHSFAAIGVPRQRAAQSPGGERFHGVRMPSGGRALGWMVSLPLRLDGSVGELRPFGAGCGRRFCIADSKTVSLLR